MINLIRIHMCIMYLYFISQAKSLGEFLKSEKFTRIFSSDLKRCRDTTANIVSNLQTNVPEIKYDAVLRERVTTTFNI